MAKEYANDTNLTTERTQFIIYSVEKYEELVLRPQKEVS